MLEISSDGCGVSWFKQCFYRNSSSLLDASYESLNKLFSANLYPLCEMGKAHCGHLKREHNSEVKLKSHWQNKMSMHSQKAKNQLPCQWSKEEIKFYANLHLGHFCLILKQNRRLVNYNLENILYNSWYFLFKSY